MIKQGAEWREATYEMGEQDIFTARQGTLNSMLMNQDSWRIHKGQIGYDCFCYKAIGRSLGIIRYLGWYPVVLWGK